MSPWTTWLMPAVFLQARRLQGFYAKLTRLDLMFCPRLREAFLFGSTCA